MDLARKNSFGSLTHTVLEMELNVAVFFKVELSLPINTCTLASSHFYLSVYWHQGFY